MQSLRFVAFVFLKRIHDLRNGGFVAGNIYLDERRRGVDHVSQCSHLLAPTWNWSFFHSIDAQSSTFFISVLAGPQPETWSRSLFVVLHFFWVLVKLLRKNRIKVFFDEFACRIIFFVRCVFSTIGKFRPIYKKRVLPHEIVAGNNIRLCKVLVGTIMIPTCKWYDYHTDLNVIYVCKWKNGLCVSNDFASLVFTSLAMIK